MSEIESILVSLFVIALVIIVISNISIIKLLSKILSKTSQNSTETEIAAVSDTAVDTNVNDVSTGELKLIDVDDDTAAIIMAIVSHETQIPLSELLFKSIKAI